MMHLFHSLVFLELVVSTLCYPGEFIPKSYYLIDHNGEQSDVVYFRNKRDIENFPSFVRSRRSSPSKATATSFASSGSSADFPQFNPSDFYNPGVVDPGFAPNWALQNTLKGLNSIGQNIPSPGANSGQDNRGPVLFSRSGEGIGSGISVSGSAQGPRGAFSSSSAASDSDGRVSYSVKSGKY